MLFINSGGNSRVAGVMLAAATFAVMLIGPIIIGYIPIMVVGALIFYLGLSLLKEALVDNWGQVHRLEFLTIIIIVVTMGAWDFVIGILVGILLACVSFVLQTSQISAIRGKLYGGVANSTVRRHPIQHRFLTDAGQQIYVMKLAGFLFFGTIVGVEKHIRALLSESFKDRPIRFLVLDLYNVDGVDYSAAETFQRVKRTLNVQGVQLVVCGVSMESEVGKSLRNVGLFDEGDGIECFQSLNSALEFCENELLKAFYQQRDSEVETESSPAFLGESTLDILWLLLILIVPQKYQSQSSEARHCRQKQCTTLLADSTFTKLLQRRSASKILPRGQDGKTTSSRYSLYCRLSQPFPTSPKTSGIESSNSSREKSTKPEAFYTTLAIRLRASTCSKVVC